MHSEINRRQGNISRSVGITVDLLCQALRMFKFSHYALSTLILQKENCMIMMVLLLQ